MLPSDKNQPILNRLESSRKSAPASQGSARGALGKPKDETFFKGRSIVSRFEIKRFLEKNKQIRSELAKELKLKPYSPEMNVEIKKIQERIPERFGGFINTAEARRALYEEYFNAKKDVREKSKAGITLPEARAIARRKKAAEFLKKKFGLGGANQAVTPRFSQNEKAESVLDLKPPIDNIRKERMPGQPVFKEESLGQKIFRTKTFEKLAPTSESRAPIVRVLDRPAPVSQKQPAALRKLTILERLKNLFVRPQILDKKLENTNKPGQPKPLAPIIETVKVKRIKAPDAVVKQEALPSPQENTLPNEPSLPKVETKDEAEITEEITPQDGQVSGGAGDESEERVFPFATREYDPGKALPSAKEQSFSRPDILGPKEKTETSVSGGKPKLPGLKFQEKWKIEEILNKAREYGLLHPPTKSGGLTPDEIREYEILELEKMFPRYFGGITDVSEANTMIEELSWNIKHMEKNPKNWKQMDIEKNKLKLLKDIATISKD